MNNHKKFDCFEDIEYNERGSLTSRDYYYNERSINQYMIHNNNNNHHLYKHYIINTETNDNKYQSNNSNISPIYKPLIKPKLSDNSSENFTLNLDN
jgi:hypothetical protein